MKKILCLALITFSSSSAIALSDVTPEDIYKPDTIEMSISYDDYNQGMTKYLNDEQCKILQLTKPKLNQTGTKSYQLVTNDWAKFYILLEIAETGKLTSIKLHTENLSSNNDFEGFKCITYATLMTIYERYETPFGEKRLAKLFTELTQIMSFETLFIKNKIRVSNSPHEIEFHHRINEKDWRSIETRIKDYQ